MITRNRRFSIGKNVLVVPAQDREHVLEGQKVGTSGDDGFGGHDPILSFIDFNFLTASEMEQKYLFMPVLLKMSFDTGEKIRQQTRS